MFPRDVVMLFYKYVHFDLVKKLNIEYRTKIKCDFTGEYDTIYYDDGKVFLFYFNFRALDKISPCNGIYNINCNNMTKGSYRSIAFLPLRYIYTKGV